MIHQSHSLGSIPRNPGARRCSFRKERVEFWDQRSLENCSGLSPRQQVQIRGAEAEQEEGIHEFQKNTTRGRAEQETKWKPVAAGRAACVLLHSFCGVAHHSPEFCLVPTGLLFGIGPAMSRAAAGNRLRGTGHESRASWESDSFACPLRGDGTTSQIPKPRPPSTAEMDPCSKPYSPHPIKSTPERVGAQLPGMGSVLQQESQNCKEHVYKTTEQRGKWGLRGTLKEPGKQTM